jgi:hypothetical protein
MSGNTLKGPKIDGKDEYYPYPADATPHVIYQAKENEKIIVIGDVHGCLTELKNLLEKSQYKKGESTVIFVGDLVNAGPHSVEVVRFVMNEGTFLLWNITFDNISSFNLNSNLIS